jgi:hypothetical protein
MKTLFPILLIIFFHLVACCRFNAQNTFIQEQKIVKHDAITWRLREDSTVSWIYIEKDRENASEYRKNHPDTLDGQASEDIFKTYFHREAVYIERILLHCFSDEDLSKLLMINREKFRIVIAVHLQNNGKALNVDITPIPRIKKNDFLTSSEIQKFINNIKMSLFPKPQGLPYTGISIPVWKSHLMAETERRAMSIYSSTSKEVNSAYLSDELIPALQEQLNLLSIENKANNKFQKHLLVDLLIATGQVGGIMGLYTVSDNDKDTYCAWLQRIVNNDARIDRRDFLQEIEQYYSLWLKRYNGQSDSIENNPDYNWQWDTFFNEFNL